MKQIQRDGKTIVHSPTVASKVQKNPSRSVSRGGILRNTVASSPSSSTSRSSSSGSRISSSVGRGGVVSPSSPVPSPSSSSSRGRGGLGKGGKISRSRYDKHKQASVLTTKKKHKTKFAIEYSSGSLPFRINHGSSRMRLHWDVPMTDIPHRLPEILKLAAEGHLEIEHPYTVLSRLSFREILSDPSFDPLSSVEVLPALVLSLRSAIVQNKQNFDLVDASLSSLAALSNAFGEALNDHLSSLLIVLKGLLPNRKFGPIVMNLIDLIDENGGPNATKLIQSKIPTFNT